MRVDVLTLFPEMFSGPFSSSIMKRARERRLLDINLVNIRDFSTNKHHTVDDTPYGGGAGMVMSAEPIFLAVQHVVRQLGKAPQRVVMMCPRGKPFNQAMALDMAVESNLVIICGHYEGIDERVREMLVTDEVSIGDFVLTGGELPAMVLIDAITRLIPGVLGGAFSTKEESFRSGLLEYPQYTRPRLYQGSEVPDVLLSGHHGEVRKWRRRQSLLLTLACRPDLLSKADLTREDKDILKSIADDLQGLDL